MRLSLDAGYQAPNESNNQQSDAHPHRMDSPARPKSAPSRHENAEGVGLDRARPLPTCTLDVSDVEAECLRTDPDLRRSPAQRSDQAFLRLRALGPDGHLRVSCGLTADWPTGSPRSRGACAAPPRSLRRRPRPAAATGPARRSPFAVRHSEAAREPGRGEVQARRSPGATAQGGLGNVSLRALPRDRAVARRAPPSPWGGAKVKLVRIFRSVGTAFLSLSAPWSAASSPLWSAHRRSSGEPNG